MASGRQKAHRRREFVRVERHKCACGGGGSAGSEGGERRRKYKSSGAGIECENARSAGGIGVPLSRFASGGAKAALAGCLLHGKYGARAFFVPHSGCCGIVRRSGFTTRNHEAEIASQTTAGWVCAGEGWRPDGRRADRAVRPTECCRVIHVRRRD